MFLKNIIKYLNFKKNNKNNMKFIYYFIFYNYYRLELFYNFMIIIL